MSLDCSVGHTLRKALPFADGILAGQLHATTQDSAVVDKGSTDERR